MAIISRIEARSTRGRLIHAAIFLVLTLGGLTTVYPFAVMISGALRSQMDEADMTLVPAFLVDDDVLYRKFLETKYNQDVQALDRAHGTQSYSFRTAALPQSVVDRRIEDLREFLHEAGPPQHWQVLGGTYGYQTVPENLRAIRDRLDERFHGDLAALSRELGAAVNNWANIAPPPPDWVTQRFDYQDNALYQEYFKLADDRPLAERQIVMLTGYFLETMVYPVYERASTAAYNAAHVGKLETYADFVLPRTVPPEDQPTLRREWIEFVRNELNPSFVLLEGVAEEAYRAFLRDKYSGDVQAMGRLWGASVESFDAVALPAGQWLQRARRQDYLDFLLTLPPERYRLVGPEYAWRDWL